MYKVIVSAGLLFLSSCLTATLLYATEPSEAARKLLSELSIRETAEALNTDNKWAKPKRIVLVTAGRGAGLDDQSLAALKSAADGAELIIVNDISEAGDKLKDAEVMLGTCTLVDSSMLALKWVQHFSAGVEECLDKQDTFDSGVILSNMKGVYGAGIAEHVIAMMFSFSRGLHQFRQQQFDKNWDRSLAQRYPMQELRGKTILLVGLGGIGTEIAWRAHGLGMRVIASRNSRRQKPDFVDYVGLSDELLSLAAKADIIVNTTPLTTATTGLFDARFFSALKPTAYFINVGRGKSVVTEALVDALQNNRLAGAGLDVFDPEPLPQDHPLWAMPNVIITPHISGYSDLVMERFWVFIRENLRRYVAGEKLLNVVNIKKGY